MNSWSNSCSKVYELAKAWRNTRQVYLRLYDATYLLRQYFTFNCLITYIHCWPTNSPTNQYANIGGFYRENAKYAVRSFITQGNVQIFWIHEYASFMGRINLCCGCKSVACCCKVVDPVLFGKKLVKQHAGFEITVSTCRSKNFL